MQPKAAGKWQQHLLNKGLHTFWRSSPVTAKTLFLAEDFWQGSNKQVNTPIVLVEGDWLLFTNKSHDWISRPIQRQNCLRLIRLQAPPHQTRLQDPVPVLREREMRLHYKHGLSHFWLDSGVPSPSPGLGAADLCMPFVAQGRGSSLTVWKYDQNFPMAELHHKPEQHVTAVSIERTPWGQYLQAESLRLVSCTTAGKVCVWHVDSMHMDTLLWQGDRTELFGKQHGDDISLSAVAMFSLSRPQNDGRSGCCVAVGTADHGIAVISLKFRQHGPLEISSMSVKLLLHTAPVIRLGVCWDHTPPVCPFPGSLQAEASVHERSDAEEAYCDAEKGLADHEICEPLADRIVVQSNRDRLAASNDQTHLFAIWGPVSDSRAQGPTSSSTDSSKAQSNQAQRWSCLQGSYTPQQMQATQICCSTVACFDVIHQDAHISHKHAEADDHLQLSAQGFDQGRLVQPCSDGHDGGVWVKSVWSLPVIGAAQLSAADGAVAVACSDGMLLLIDQATGKLMRRIPNMPVDQRFMEHPKSHVTEEQRNIAFEHTAWSAAKSAACCNIWWGQLASDCGPADYGLTAVTVFAKASFWGAGAYPELAIHRYSCAKQHNECCCRVNEAGCSVGRDLVANTNVKTTVAAPVADCSDGEEQDCILDDIKIGAGHQVSNCHSLGIHLPHQPLVRRYMTCSRCRGVTEFLD